MSTTPRFASAAPDQPSHLRTTIAAYHPELMRAFAELYGTFWSHGVLEHRVKEVARLRNARITDCGY
jgi:hypothetical protein